MTAHSQFIGGSSAERRIHCPGSAKLEAGFPDTSSEAADEGSMLHSAVEFVLTAPDEFPMSPCRVRKRGLDWTFEPLPQFPKAKLSIEPNREVPPLLLEGWLFEDYDDHPLTLELIETKLLPALDAWYEVRDKYELDAALFEQRVHVPGAGFGTADVLASSRRPGLKVVLDWKFGRGQVSARENYQLAYYALGAMLETDQEVRDLMAGAQNLVFAVVQPAMAEVYDVWETTTSWLDAYHATMRKALTLIEGGNAPVKPGRWCRWCKAKPACPALLDAALMAPKVSPAGLSEIELSFLLGLLGPLEEWIKGVRAHANHEMDRGVVVPGWKRVARRPVRKWRHDYEVEVVLGEMGIGAPYTTKLWSPAQAEKALGKKNLGPLEDLIVKESSGTVMVPDTDPRQTVSAVDELAASAPLLVQREQET